MQKELEGARERVERECGFVKEKYMQMIVEVEQRGGRVLAGVREEVQQVKEERDGLVEKLKVETTNGMKLAKRLKESESKMKRIEDGREKLTTQQ